MENELSMLSSVFVACIPVVATIMEALRSWIDKQNKLKPYWFYIAIALSLAGSALFSFLTGWNWVEFVLQGLVIYGGQHIVQQSWFKKLWPIIKETITALSTKSKKNK